MSGKERCGSMHVDEKGVCGTGVGEGGRRANFPVHTLRNLLFSGLKNFNLSLPLAGPSFVNSRRSIVSGGHYSWL